MLEITSTITPETRKPLFVQQESQQFQFFTFPVEFYDGEINFRSQNYFSQAEISYESKGNLRPDESFGKMHRVKKSES